jgi:hypothetical protein
MKFLQRTLQARISAESLFIPSSTNLNAAKLSILRAMFKAFVVNNRVSNGRQHGIHNLSCFFSTQYVLILHKGIKYWFSSNIKRIRYHTNRVNEKEKECFISLFTKCIQIYKSQGKLSIFQFKQTFNTCNRPITNFITR